MAKIYLSSTFEDLKAYRETVYRTLRQMRHDVIAMEDYIATDMRPLDLCLTDVATSDLYVGIFAWRYGYIPSKDNPEQKSITELEYRKAIELHKPTRIFLLEKEAPWPPTQMDLFTGDGEHGKLIAELRQELGLEKTVSFFHSQDQLAQLVSTAVANWEKGIPFADPRTKYLEQVCKHYSSVKLPIGPSEGLSLQATFQPLKLRKDPLAAEDLELENRRALLSEMEDETDNLTQAHSKQQTREHYNRIILASSEEVAKNGDEAIEKSPQGRLVVLGGPGTGKTTLLKYLVSDRAHKALIDPTTLIPVYLSLADLARKEVSFQRYLVELVENMSADRGYAEALWREIENGRAFICLDSLDEVAPQQRQKMIELIHTLVAMRGNTWIIGSRFTEYKGGDFKHAQFSDWELQPMDHKLRLEMAEGLLPELQRLLFIPPSVSLTPQHFVLRLEKHPQAATWGKNPLLFSLAAVVFVKTGDLPPSRAMLYREVIDAVIKTRETDPVWRRSLSRMLGALALWIHEKKGRTFSMDDLLDFFADIQRKSWEETSELVKRLVNSGVIEIVARHTYGFRHQTFQEYLAATELARGLTSDDTKVREYTLNIAWSKRTFSRWTEVLRLMVGVLTLEYGNKGQTEAIRWLRALIEQRTSASGDPGNLGLMLAFKSFGEITKWSEWHKGNKEGLEEEIVSLWADALLDAARSNRQTERLRIEILTQEVTYLSKHAIEILTEQLVFAFHDWNSNVRYAAARALGELGERVPLEPLLAALQDPNSSVRSAAAQALGELGERVPLEPLLAALQDPNSSARAATARALGKLGQRVPLEPLLAALQDHEESVRSAAAQALGELGERVPLEPLLAALQDPNPSMRSAAAEALGKLGERVPLEPLLAALQDPNPSMRYAAARALGELGERVPLEPLLAALQGSEESVRSAAAWALGKLGERVPLEPLLAALQDPNPSMRSAAARALGELGERVPLEPLLAALQDPNSSVRYAAARALGKLGERVPLEPLLAALQDHEESVRSAAAQALGKLGERVPLEPLLAALQDPNSSARAAAARALGKLGERVPLEPLLAALQDPNSSMRSAAAEALGELGERVPLEPLLAALQDPNSSVRSAAARALGKLGERVPLEPLLAALQDHEESVRSAAAQALGKLGERVPLEPLLAALQDPNSSVRSAAAWALGKLGERVPLEPLLAALQDSEESVRYAAAEALGELGERVPLEPLLAALQGSEESVRSAAAWALGELGERVPLEPLLAALQDPNPSMRSAAAEALGELGERVPLEPLLAALQDPNSSVRSAAAWALGELGERVPLEPLLAALQDHEESVRSSAAQALGELGERVPLEPLLAALQDPNSSVRSAAARALGKLGERVPLEPLLAALQGSEESVRSAAAQALGKLGERVPLEPLLAALQDPNSSVRSAAAEALGELGERVPPEPIIEMVGDTVSFIRNAAVESLKKISPASLETLLFEAVKVIIKQGSSTIFDSIIKQEFAKIVSDLGLSFPPLRDKLTQLLKWHYWPVRATAARALGKLHRNISDEAIKQLLEMRRNPNERKAVQEAADDALSEILSLESIEDD